MPLDQMESAQPEAVITSVRVANLDFDNIFFGLEDRLVSDLKPGDLVFGDPAIIPALPAGVCYVDKNCDNAPGKYKWDATIGKAGCFTPLAPNQQKLAEAAPTLDQALYDLITLGADAPRVQAWARWFEKTLDAKE